MMGAVSMPSLLVPRVKILDALIQVKTLHPVIGIMYS